MVVRTSSSRRGILKKAKPITAEQWKTAKKKTISQLSREEKETLRRMKANEHFGLFKGNAENERGFRIKKFITADNPSLLTTKDLSETSSKEFNMYRKKLIEERGIPKVNKREFFKEVIKLAEAEQEKKKRR